MNGPRGRYVLLDGHGMYRVCGDELHCLDECETRLALRYARAGMNSGLTVEQIEALADTQIQ